MVYTMVWIKSYGVGKDPVTPSQFGVPTTQAETIGSALEHSECVSGVSLGDR